MIKIYFMNLFIWILSLIFIYLGDYFSKWLYDSPFNSPEESLIISLILFIIYKYSKSESERK